MEAIGPADRLCLLEVTFLMRVYILKTRLRTLSYPPIYATDGIGFV
jgi:hypothetical protein